VSAPSERLRHAIENVASAGFQLSRDAFELLSVMDEMKVDDCVREAIEKAGQISPKPLVLTRDFFERPRSHSGAFDCA